MEPVERRTNTFAALGAGDKKKKTAPPTFASVQQHQKAPQVFVRSRDLIEGSWADDSFDDQPAPAKNGVIVDADGFVTKPVKGKKASAFTSVVEAPVTDAGFDDDEEEEEPEISEESSEEEEEDAPAASPAPVEPAAEKKAESKEPVLSKKYKKKKEAEELEALLQELALESKTEAAPEKTQEAPVDAEEGEGGENAAKKKKKKKPAKKKEDGAEGSEPKPAAEPAPAPVKKPVKKEGPKKSAVELAAIKEAKEREERLKKKSKAKKLDFEFIN